MRTLTIAVLVGSLRRDSFNRRLATALARLAPGDVEFRQLEIGDLPLYNQDDDGVLFVTPEYNRSVPGVLKNAIDHASRPYGHSAFAGKPAGILGMSR